MTKKKTLVKRPTQLKDVLEDMLAGLEIYQNLKAVERELELKEQHLVKIGDLQEKEKVLVGEIKALGITKDDLLAEIGDFEKNAEVARKEARAIVAEAENVRVSAERKSGEIVERNKALSERNESLNEKEKLLYEKEGSLGRREAGLDKREAEFNESLKSLLSKEA